jgi:MFS family permease
VKLLEGFDRDLKFLTLSLGLRRIVMGFFEVVRAIYLALLGFSPIEIGLLLSLATFVSAIHHVTFGLLSDRFGRRPFLLLGNCFAVLRMILFASSTDFWVLALGQGVGALGEGVGAGQPVVSGYITDKVKSEKRTPVFTTIAITNSIAATLGSLMAGFPVYLQESLYLSVVDAHSILFWACAVTTLVSLLFVVQVKEVRPAEADADNAKPSLVHITSWGMIGRFTLVRSTSGLGWGFIDSLLPLYFFLRFDIGSDILGPIYALTRFFSIFSYLLIPRVVDRFGNITPIIVSRVLTAVLATAFAFTNWYELAIILLTVLRTAILFTMPIRQTFATRLVAPSEIATAIGISNFVRMSLRTLAPTLAGYMFEAVSLSLPFLSGAGLFAVNAVLYHALFSQDKT